MEHVKAMWLLIQQFFLRWEIFLPAIILEIVMVFVICIVLLCISSRKTKMKNIDRIDPIILELANVWYSNPDLRLCQLLSNVAISTGRKHHADLFYFEDDELLKGLKELRNKLS